MIYKTGKFNFAESFTSHGRKLVLILLLRLFLFPISCNKIEYASSYVWHENAYSNKPERQMRSRSRHCSQYRSLQQLNIHSPKQQQQPDILESVLYFPFHSTSPRLDDDVKVNKAADENEINVFSNGGSNSRRKPNMKQKPRRPSSLSLRRYSLDADARGIKSHFIPATLEVLLDLGGLHTCKSTAHSESEGNGVGSRGFADAMEVHGDKCPSANQYFSSVYQNDFSGTKYSNV